MRRSASFVRQDCRRNTTTVDVAEEGERRAPAPWAARSDYDLVILDLNLPAASDGVAVLRHLRLKAGPLCRLLVLTLRSRVEDRVQCLGHRRRRLSPETVFLQRTLGPHSRPAAGAAICPRSPCSEVEDLKLDRVEHAAERAGRRIELTSKEFSLLEYLMRNAGRQVSPRHDHRTRLEPDF